MKTKRLQSPDGKRYTVNVKINKHGLHKDSYQVLFDDRIVKRCRTFGEALSRYMYYSEKDRQRVSVRKVSDYEIDIKEDKS